MSTKTSKLITAALLIALSIVLTRVFSANLLIAGVPAARLSVGFLPIILAGIALGPYFGMAVGAASDVLGYFLFPVGVYFPPITLTSALVGLLAYLIYRYTARSREWIRLLSCVAVTQIACSMLLQTLWISILYGKGYLVLFPARAITALITIPIYYFIIHAIVAGLKGAKLLKANV